MGKAGAETLLHRINHPKAHHPQHVIVQPELVIRESTAQASSRCPSPAQKLKRPAARTRA
jgi:hypothetical protein